MARFYDEFIAHYMRDQSELALLKAKAIEILRNEIGDNWSQYCDIYKIYCLSMWLRSHMRFRTISEEIYMATDHLKTGEMLCRGYSRVMVALSYSIGYESRVVHIGEDINNFDLPGHFVAEVFVPFILAPDGSYYKKWVMFDTTYAQVICHNGIYLNCLDLYNNPGLYQMYINKGLWNQFDDFFIRMFGNLVIIEPTPNIVDHVVNDIKSNLKKMGYTKFKEKFYKE
jgi:hypothetical protein